MQSFYLIPALICLVTVALLADYMIWWLWKTLFRLFESDVSAEVQPSWEPVWQSPNWPSSQPQENLIRSAAYGLTETKAVAKVETR